MATGRPDYTFLSDVDIVAQTIGNISVDIVAQTLAKLNVDIVAQTLAKLNVDIIAQTVGDIAVDIAAQSVGNMAVNIAAQDLAQLLISITAQTVGVYLQPEWSIQQGSYKNVGQSSAVAKSYGDTVSTSYTPGVGKTFYVTCVSWRNVAHSEGDGDSSQHCEVTLGAIGMVQFHWGANGGGAINFNRPWPYTSIGGSEAVVINRADHDTIMAVCMQGYEI